MSELVATEGSGGVETSVITAEGKDPNHLIHMITDGKNPRGIPAARFFVRLNLHEKLII